MDRFSRSSALRLLFALLASLAAIAPARAEAGRFANGSFRVLSIAGSHAGLQYDLAPGKPGQVVLYQTLSGYYPRPPGPRLEIYREFPPTPDAPPGTPPLRYPAITAALAPTPKHWIILATPVSASALAPMGVRAVPDDRDLHRSGTMKIVNFSSYPVALAIDGRIYETAVNEERVVPLKPARNFFTLKTAVQKGGAWSPGYEEEFRYRDDLRGFVFIADYVQDPGFEPLPIPPVVLVKTHFEKAPDAYPRQPAQPAGR